MPRKPKELMPMTEWRLPSKGQDRSIDLAIFICNASPSDVIVVTDANDKKMVQLVIMIAGQQLEVRVDGLLPGSPIKPTDAAQAE